MQHKSPKKIVNIICIINQYQLFCEERVERVLRLSPQDLNSFAENLSKTHDTISKKNKDDLIFDCVGDRSKSNNEERYRSAKKTYASNFIDDFFKKRDSEIDKPYAENKDQQEISIHPSSNASTSLVKNKGDANSEQKFVYVKKYTVF